MKNIFIIFLVGIGYYLFIQCTGIYIPCLFYRTTGLLCPGCGISHLCSDLLSLRFDTAFRQNIGISILMFVYIIWLILRYGFQLKWCTSQKEHYLMILFVVLLIVYGILRNLNGFEFLMPYYMQ